MIKMLKITSICICLLFSALVFNPLQAQTDKEKGTKMERGEVSVRWFGHTCFMLSDSIRVITDPFDKRVGYSLPDVSADMVLVSHEHSDHNNVSAIKGKPKIIRGEKEITEKGVTFKAVKSSHGNGRGENYIRIWELEGIKFAHFGDLGVDLSDSLYQEIGSVDAVFIPVGGYYTIDAKEATKIIKQLNPSVVFPMHYKTAVMGPNFPISGIEPFLKGKKNINKVSRNSVILEKDSLPEKMTIYVLEYK